MKVLIKPKVTKPWSKDMYDYNDKVADMMKISSNLFTQTKIIGIISMN